jgi:hypothetical protein
MLKKTREESHELLRLARRPERRARPEAPRNMLIESGGYREEVDSVKRRPETMKKV